MSTTKPGNTDEQQPVTQIAAGIYQIRIPLFDSNNVIIDKLNSYLIEGSSGWLMIDTGWYHPLGFQALESSLRKLNLDFSDINSIVLTHTHPDHCGMAGKIKQLAPKIELLCHHWEADLIEERYIKFSESQKDIVFLFEKHGVPEKDLQMLGSASMDILQNIIITLPDHLLYGGENINTGIYDLEVIWTSGHSPGHICLYEPDNQLLFCGDHILPTITPNIGYNIFSGDNPLGDYHSSLNKLSHLEIACAHPAHEYSFNDVKSRIKAILEHHNFRENEIQRLISNKISNSYEIARELTWNLNLPWDQFPPLQKRFAITETIAHLEHMRWEGQIRKTFKNNRIYYALLPEH